MRVDDTYQRSPDIISRRIRGEAVLVPIRQRVGALDAIFALNDTASAVWAGLDGQKTLRQVLAQVTAEFEVDEAEASRDLLEVIAAMAAVGAVTQVEAHD